MTETQLRDRLAQVVHEQLPHPGFGATGERHRRLAEIGREDLTLAKLAEAHWDAVAILAESGRQPSPNALYAVWASEIPGRALELVSNTVNGSKGFCSGVDLVDRALVTVAIPETRLVEIELRKNGATIVTDLSAWHVGAFRDTHTGAITFNKTPIVEDGWIGEPGWYTERPGFWHGACGPAACWAGGIAGLVDAATINRRTDSHTLAHLGAIHSDLWAVMALIEQAGGEIDKAPKDVAAAQIRALKLRHLVEQLGTDVLRRFARAYGPAPLSMDQDIARRYQEIDLYLRQSHGERDLEVLARLIRSS